MLVAVGLSLIVNFSIFIFKLMPAPSGPPNGFMKGLHSEAYQWLQIFYYFIFSFILLSVSTYKLRKEVTASFAKRILICMGIAFVFYFIAPRVNRFGELIFTFQSNRVFDPTLLLKISFTLIVSLLYGKIYELIYQKQHMLIENEVLKNENLQTTYNTLINQINPHFFFNSLNSLAMLVREKHNEQALIYIDRLSDTFRYIIQNGQTGIITLEEELKFTESYNYLLEVRYKGKLFFDIDIDPRYNNWTLPSLTLQPLLENIVKHNTITKTSPIRVSIRTRNGFLEVSNPINPKLSAEMNTGIGLKNLSDRYNLLTGEDFKIVNDDKTFTVVLPLGHPNS